MDISTLPRNSGIVSSVQHYDIDDTDLNRGSITLAAQLLSAASSMSRKYTLELNGCLPFVQGLTDTLAVKARNPQAAYMGARATELHGQITMEVMLGRADTGPQGSAYIKRVGYNATQPMDVVLIAEAAGLRIAEDKNVQAHMAGLHARMSFLPFPDWASYTLATTEATDHTVSTGNPPDFAGFVLSFDTKLSNSFVAVRGGFIHTLEFTNITAQMTHVYWAEKNDDKDPDDDYADDEGDDTLQLVGASHSITTPFQEVPPEKGLPWGAILNALLD